MVEATDHETERQGIRVGRASADELDRWDGLVGSSQGGTFFHRRAPLRVLADHSGTTLHPLMGYKGQEPVGLFPAFAYSKAGVTAAFSPPPDLRVPYLGPALLNFEKLKRRRAEKRHRRFVEAALAWIDDVIDPRYVHVRTDPSHPDPRPFQWNGFDATPRHTYRVDLSVGAETLLERFSSDARRNVDTEADGVTIRVGGRDHVAAIFDQVRERYSEQGERFGVATSFVTDLYDRTADGSVRPYVCTVDDEFVGGVLTLRDETTVYGWQGGVKTDASVPLNDLLDWHIMREAMDEERPVYDLVGANTPRLCEYKSKFAPDVCTYYSLERAGLPARAAVEMYRRYLGA